MIFFTAAYFKRAIYLFYEEESYHLVGEGHTREADAFVGGAAELLGVAFIIGISRGITVLMDSGAITDTILHWGEVALEGTSSLVFIVLVYLIYLPLSVLIPSSSA